MVHQTLMRCHAAIQSRSNSIILCAFDLLHLNGVDLRQQILLDRRAELSNLLGGDPDQPHSVQRGVRRFRCRVLQGVR